MEGARAAAAACGDESLDQVTSLTGGREYGSDSAGTAIRQAGVDSRANNEIAYYTPALRQDGRHLYALAPLASPRGLATGLRSRGVPSEIDAAAHSPFDAAEIGLRAIVSPDPVHPQNRRFEVYIDAADLLPRPALDPDAGKVCVAFVVYDESRKPLAQPALVRLTQKQLKAIAHGEIALRETIPIRRGIRQVRVIVFHASVGTVGSVTIPLGGRADAARGILLIAMSARANIGI